MEKPRIEDNLGLVVAFVRQFGRRNGQILLPKGAKSTHGIPVEDTEEYSIACEGLLRAINTYDPNIGCFSTYAVRCMRNALLTEKRKPSVSLELVDQKQIEAMAESQNCTIADVESIVQHLITDREEKDVDQLDKEIMLMYYLESKTLKEIGKIFGFGKARAKQRISRAIAKMQRKQLLNKGT